MKKSTTILILATMLLSATAAQASEFKGGYVGGKIGYNTNSPDSTATSDEFYPGLEAGYGWDKNEFLLGVNAFLDHHTQSITGADFGADMKLGFPSGKYMPFIKLGLAGSDPGTRLHGGLGIEFKFSPQWSIAAEWTADSKSVNSVSNKNNNISVGLNYYFDKPYVAPAVVAAVAPAVAKQLEPVVVPAPVVIVPAPAPKPVVVAEPPPPAPAPKTIFNDRPITIEGANFDTASAKLKPTAFQQLDVVVEFAAKYKEAQLKVVGFTDSRGMEQYNQSLSAKRAQSVKAYLVSKGIAANRIITSGKGSADPVDDNKTSKGRAKNRRVEIHSVERVAQ